MGNQKILSTQFNMSLGYIPVIISMILCEIIEQDIAIYVGTGVGVISSLYVWFNKETRVPQLMLYSITAMLMLFSFISLFLSDYHPTTMMPFTLEISAVIPPFIIYFNKKRFMRYEPSSNQKNSELLLAQGIEASIVSSRVVLIISLLHFIMILFSEWLFSPMSLSLHTFLFRIAPPCVFLLSILFNQFGLIYFNKLMEDTLFLPIVDKEGQVFGKVMIADAVSQKNDYIIPFVRIAVTVNGMLYLSPRPLHDYYEAGKTDLTLESFLLYGETLEKCIERMTENRLSPSQAQNIYFNFMYHHEDSTTNRLIYLFTLDLDDDAVLSKLRMEGGKLWTFRQIEHNLNRNFFCNCFEHEYEFLKTIILTRQQYKETPAH